MRIMHSMWFVLSASWIGLMLDVVIQANRSIAFEDGVWIIPNGYDVAFRIYTKPAVWKNLEALLI